MDKIPPKAVILPEIEPLSFQAGGMEHTDTNKILFPDGNCIDYLPTYETQAMVYFDTYGCVSHSLQNDLETLIRKLDYTFANKQWLLNNIYDDNDEPNFSDRDLVVMSGTKPGVGNSGNQVLKTAQREGLISETLEPWDENSRDPDYNITETYYAYTRTEEAREMAEEFNKRFEIIGTWIYTPNRESFKQAMKTGAVQVYVNAWHKNDEGKYYNPTGGITHAVQAVDYDTCKIFDTYEPKIKELASWDDAHVWALKINIIEKNMATKPQLEQNTLVLLVEGSGEIGLYLDGKIIVDDTAKILSVFMARNAKDGKFKEGNVRSLTQAQWDLFDKRNL